jgi:hypothetical protein
MRSLALTALVFVFAVPALAEEKRIDLYKPDGTRKGHVIVDEKTGRLDTYAPDGRRTGWGRIAPDGRTDLYRLDGSRVGTAKSDKRR